LIRPFGLYRELVRLAGKGLARPNHHHLIAPLRAHEYEVWARIAKQAKVHEATPAFAQAMRANCASDMHEQAHSPMAVAAWLGHDVRVAQQHYYTSTPDLMARITGELPQTPPQTNPE
jgi:hypothetical protein